VNLLSISGLLLTVLCIATFTASPAAGEGSFGVASGMVPDLFVPYPVVDTGQTECFNNIRAIPCPQQGQAFFGQDAQYLGNQPAYTLSSDGLTVNDTVTGLTWQRSPDTSGDGSINAEDKLTWPEAMALPLTLNAENYGGHHDWRLPSIKELYSLILFSGTDPSDNTATSTAGLTPFINTDYFVFAYGDTSAGERIIDSQYASSTKYVASDGIQGGKVFGVNFADGRIKGYDLVTADGGEKTFFVICVRGNPEYGRNEFIANGDGTISDQATGLMWLQSDSGQGMDWEEALAWVQDRNAANYLGYRDWRLPNAKELQSIVDYSRSPDTTDSPAIDPLFSCSMITNEAGQSDYPYYWTSTTHESSNGLGGFACYISFGRALGSINGRWVDIHGAGAQRSDPKVGNAADYPQGHGPQGDAIRIDNYVRMVRGGNVTLTMVPASPGATGSSPDQSGNSVLEQIISWFRNLLGA
jgi:hypothetical protein